MTKCNFETYSEKYGELFYAQLELEESFKQLASARKEQEYEKAKSDGLASETALGSKLIANEIENVVDGIKNFVQMAIKPKPGVKPSYYAIVKQLSDIYAEEMEELYDLLAFATFSAVLNGVLKKESFLSNVAKQISYDIWNEVKLQAFLKEFPDKKANLLDGMDKRVGNSYKLYYARHFMEHDGFVFHKWAKQESLHFGAYLIEILTKTTKCFELTSLISEKGNNTLEVIPTQWFLKAWATNESNIILKAHKMSPSVIPPRPWTSYTDGGYYGKLTEFSKLLRLYDVGNNSFSKDYMKRLNQVDLSNVFDAINALQETPWKINRRILKVIQAIKQRGGEIGEFPRLEPYPELPRLNNPTEEELAEHKKKSINRHLREARRKALALRALSHLEQAEKFAAYERIYFPCNMDFRGRIYPIPPFNFQGDDINKSLLLFADAPPCASMEDITWLMLQGASLAGVDKVSFDDRKKWVLENEEKILASASEPLSFLWWSEQDSPFQFLAFCFEWQSWRDYESKHGTAKGFIAEIPIAFDGTCSGLQHFRPSCATRWAGKLSTYCPATSRRIFTRLWLTK